MKKILLLACFAAGLNAQLTTITDTLKNAQNRPVSGSITIDWQTPFITATGTHVAAGRVTVPVAAGVFTVQLFPNDTATPSNTSYTATYNIFNYTRGPETWVIPTSSTSLHISDVAISSPPPTPAAPWVITWGQLPAPPLTGTWCVESINAVIGWNACSTGGGGSTIAGAPSTWPNFAAVATSGSYTDLINKPTIPAAQVNSDWTASTGVAQILNKPTIPTNTSQISESGNLYFSDARAQAAMAGLYQTPISGAPSLWPTFATVAFSGAYSDLAGKPTIPAAQVNSDWTASTGVAQILNKPTLATVATSGAYADLSGKPTLATVATTGAYADLSGKPTIPAAQVNSDWTAVSGISQILNKPATWAWGSLSGVPSTFTPAAHASTHIAAGSDPLTLSESQVTNLTSDLAAKANTSALPAASSTTPSMDGSAAVGTGTTYARADHVHPTDTSRQATITGAPGTWPSFATVATSGAYADLAGKPTIYYQTTQAAGSNLTQRATLNFGSEFTAADNAGSTRTDVSINSVASSKITGLPTFPSGAIVGTTDTQTLTNKTIDGVSPATMAYVDATSSIQTQLNGKASTGSVPTASSTTPAMDGTGAVGTGTTWARADHVHPTDTSRQATLPVIAGGTNTALGGNSLSSITTGTNDTALGYNSLHSLDSGGGNSAFGLQALYSNTSGGNNAGIGQSSLYSNTTGNNNTAVGTQAGYTETSGNANTTGANNTWIGYNAGPGTSTQLTDSFSIGYQSHPTASYHGVLGDSSVTDVYFGSETPAAVTHQAAYMATPVGHLSLPTCGSSIVGQRRVVNDYGASISFGTTVVGGGSVVIGVECIYNGSAYVWIID
jgi:hypothetical protein